MEVFAVFKTGVYRHECGGIFQSLNDAVPAALSLINGEPDGYHEYEIVPFTLGLKCQQRPATGPRSGGDVVEPDRVLVLRRDINGAVTHHVTERKP